MSQKIPHRVCKRWWSENTVESEKVSSEWKISSPSGCVRIFTPFGLARSPGVSFRLNWKSRARHSQPPQLKSKTKRAATCRSAALALITQFGMRWGAARRVVHATFSGVSAAAWGRRKQTLWSLTLSVPMTDRLLSFFERTLHATLLVSFLTRAATRAEENSLSVREMNKKYTNGHWPCWAIWCYAFCVSARVTFSGFDMHPPDEKSLFLFLMSCLFAIPPWRLVLKYAPEVTWQLIRVISIPEFSRFLSICTFWVRAFGGNEPGTVFHH